jgi:cell division septation protein DedD
MRRIGIVALGFATALGVGLAGGMNIHRLVDLDQTAIWFQQTGSTLQSSFDTARKEMGRRIASFTSRPVSVAQASQDATSLATPNNDISERGVADLSLRMDQIRAAHDGSARDLGQGIEGIRNAAEQNHRELVVRLAQLTERVERVERQSVAVAAPVSPQPVTQPSTTSPGKPVAKIVPQPTPDTKAKVKPAARPAAGEKLKIAAKLKGPDAKPGTDAKGIANWTVRNVFDDTAVLEGPRGLIAVGPGDTIPGIGRVQAITRSGRRWVVLTTKGVITPRQPRTPAEPASEASVNFW